MFNFIGDTYKNLFKGIIFLFLEVSIFYVIVTNLPGITIQDYKSAFILIISLSLINAIFWPTISYFSLGFIVFTLGFGTFLIDGLFLWLISKFIGGFTIDGLALFTIPLLIGLISSLLSIILGINDDNSYYYTLLKRNLNQNNVNISKPGYIFLEIDGLAGNILDEAINKGYMPTVKQYLDISHNFTTWETDLSSQTGSSQAGILHGNNDNIPAFRWVEKENGNKIVASNGLSDAANIEKRISNNNGLLSSNGASRSNLFSGDAEDVLLTYSKFGNIKNFYTKTWYYLYSNPYNIARILILFMADMVMELLSRIRHLFTKKYRIHRGFQYFVSRAGANVVMREATTYSIIGDIYKGNYDVIYSTYMGYDEIAHHSGTRDFDSFYALRQIDNQIKRIKHAIDESNRKYRVILLSDHGQSNGPTFKQKYFITLEELVKEQLPDNIVIHSILHSNDDHFMETYDIKPYLRLNKEKINEKIDNTRDTITEHFDNTKDTITEHLDHTVESITEHIDNTKDTLKDIYNPHNSKTINTLKEKTVLLRGKDAVNHTLKKINEEYSHGLEISDKKVISDNPHSIILASGNLGLIYFTDWSKRMTYEQIEDAFPNLITTLANHPGIGFLLVKSSIYGSIVLSDDNVYYLDDDRYDGEHFLDVYGKNIIDKLKRTDTFNHVPDILVNSTYNVEKDEVYSFEELIGSHGGAGGLQQEPFIVYPNNWDKPNDIVGAQNVYKFFKDNMDFSS